MEKQKVGGAMAKERLFYVERNDSWHSYEFLAQRQNDPKWRAAFLAAETLLEQEDHKRKRRNFIILVVSLPVVLLAVLVGLYFYGSSDDEAIPKREISLNDTTTVSTESSGTAETTVDTGSVGQVLLTPWGEQVTVLRILSNGERVIKESYSPSDLNNDGVLTFEELSQVEEAANHGQQNQQVPQQENNQQQAPQPSQSDSQIPQTSHPEEQTQMTTVGQSDNAQERSLTEHQDSDQ